MNALRLAAAATVATATLAAAAIGACNNVINIFDCNAPSLTETGARLLETAEPIWARTQADLTEAMGGAADGNRADLPRPVELALRCGGRRRNRLWART